MCQRSACALARARKKHAEGSTARSWFWALHRSAGRTVCITCASSDWCRRASSTPRCGKLKMMLSNCTLSAATPAVNNWALRSLVASTLCTTVAPALRSVASAEAASGYFCSTSSLESYEVAITDARAPPSTNPAASRLTNAAAKLKFPSPNNR